jgi:hypothetical protein
MTDVLEFRLRKRWIAFGAGLIVLGAGGCASSSPTPAAAPSAAQPPVQGPTPAPPLAAGQTQDDQVLAAETYSQDETMRAAERFFGGTSEGLAKAIQRAFKDNGQPNAYIAGNEASGAIGLGLRYGEGLLYFKGANGPQQMQVYWQGPSIGFDAGGNASKSFTLVYNLKWTRDLFQRFPGVDGSLYVVAGVGLNYQRADDITLAPIRTGVGLRAGANIGYLDYTREHHINPF